MLLPNRGEDGLYSVRGAAEHFDVSTDVVRGWIKRGLVKASKEDHGPHRGILWLEIDAHATGLLSRDEASRKPRTRTRTTQS